jgi:hypothetical protein
MYSKMKRQFHIPNEYFAIENKHVRHEKILDFMRKSLKEDLSDFNSTLNEHRRS